MPTPTLAQEPMTAADRCDRCGAQAYVRVTLVAGGELMFCSHHGREHRDALQKVASDIRDETRRLQDSTSATAPLDER
ncbi:hypothetical protein ACFFKU_10085 [Kineococcus gynurae]|uniref:DUF7455 domain-containing protein n=1 Tax=Kineococcus gynurae TaxID=452979 RepID=A0ABV5LV69_9ACTN